MTESQTICKRRTRTASLQNEDGSALVEMGFALPIIFVILTGIFAFSIGLYQKLALAEGVSSGARTLAAARGATDPCAKSVTAVTSAAPTLSQSSMNVTIVINGATVVSNVAANSASCSGTSMTAGNSATLTATYPCVLKAYGYNFGSCSMSYQVAEEVQ